MQQAKYVLDEAHSPLEESSPLMPSIWQVGINHWAIVDKDLFQMHCLWWAWKVHHEQDVPMIPNSWLKVVPGCGLVT